MVEILDNTPDRMVIDAIRRYIKDSKEAYFAVGYFFLNGWNLIKENLPDNVQKGFLKIIIGRELDYPTYEEISKGYKLRLKTKMLEDLIDIKDISKIKELYELIKLGVIDFRIFLDGKLHSKLYLFINQPEYLNERIAYSPGSAIVGSSNFTVPGTLSNKELNVLITEKRDVEFLYTWFMNLWNKSEEFREDLIQVIDASGILTRKPEKYIPIGKYVNPKILFKYLVWKWLDGRIAPIERKESLAEFQIIGVVNAVNMISEHNGVIIADSVGLGKSFIGAAVIEEYIRGKFPTWDPNNRGYKKTRKVLLILPPSLIPQWGALLFKSRYFFTGNLEVKKISDNDKFVIYEILEKTSNGKKVIGEVALLSLGLFSRMTKEEVYTQHLNEDYDLILIDEAHKFRNRWTNRWTNARALRFKKKDDPHSVRNKFMLLTATPVNNTIWDIYNLLKIFCDDNFESFKNKGVHVTELFNQYREVKKKWQENPKEEAALILKAQEIKNKVLNEIMILRTRKYLMERFGKDGKIKIAGKELAFKDPIPDKIEYTLVNEKYQPYWNFLKVVEREFEELEFSFLKLYTSGYVGLSSSEFREGAKDEEEERIFIPINIILKFLLAKRLESSIFSFERTMLKLKERNDHFYSTLSTFVEKVNKYNNEEFLEKLKELAKICIRIADKEEILKEFEEETDIELQRIDPRVMMYANLLEYGGKSLNLFEEKIKTENDFFNFIEKSPYKNSFIISMKVGLKRLFKDIEKDKIILEKLKERLDEVKEKDESGNIITVDSFNEENKRVDIPKYKDPKLERLKQLIYEELAGKKFIIFTQYKDTAVYIYRTLIKWIRNQKKTLPYLFNGDKLKVGLVTGDLDMDEKEKMIKRFAPYANDAPEYVGTKEELKILISTDSLSEGVNLQDANGVVNYDLPWNPMIIVQRVGRVNRIGNEKEVFVKNFVPSKELETIMGILAKISEKIKDITFLVGKEFYILSGEEEIKIETFGEKIKEISKAKMSQLEEMSLSNDAKYIGDITKEEDIAKYELLDFIHNKLKLRPDEFDEVKELMKKKVPLYTLTKSKNLMRMYELYRGKTRVDSFIIKADGNNFSQVTCREFIKLWNAEECDDVNFSEIRKVIDRMDEYFVKNILEKRKGMRAQGGFIGWLMVYLRDLLTLGHLDDSTIDKNKLKALLAHLPFVEMHSQDIARFKNYLIESKCMDKKERIKDPAKLVDLAYKYLKVGTETERKLNYSVVGWWI